MEKVRVYVVARIAQEMHALTDEVCAPLERDESFEVFKPKDHNPWWLPPDEIPPAVIGMDYLKIRESHIGLALADFGNDCACECGVYARSDKPVILFTRGAMGWAKIYLLVGTLSAGGTRAGCVVTDNPSAYRSMQENPDLQKVDIRLLQSLEDLPEVFKSIYRERYEKSS